MRFSEEELAQIYDYVADRLIKEGIGNSTLKSTLNLIGKVEEKLAPGKKDTVADPPRPTTEGRPDAGSYIPPSILRTPSYNELRDHGMDQNGHETTKLGGRS